MLKSRHVYIYLSITILFIHDFLARYFLLSLMMGTNTLLAVKSTESGMQNLTFDFSHEVTYIIQ